MKISSFIQRGLFAIAFFILGITHLGATTVFLNEDFEGKDKTLWTEGNQSDTRASNGKYSLESFHNQITVCRGEGFFWVAGDLEKTRISFSLFSPQAKDYSVFHYNFLLKDTMAAHGTIETGQWVRITLTLANFNGKNKKESYEKGQIINHFTITMPDVFWLDDLRIESDVSEAEREEARPQRILNHIDTKKATAQVPLIILDQATGKPTAARVYVTRDGKASSNGLLFQTNPTAWLRGGIGGLDGALVYQLNESHPSFFHTPGESLLFIEPGHVVIEIIKGLEYRYLKYETDVEAGKNKLVTLKLEKWRNLSKEGFFSGDAHIHPNYGDAIYVVEPRDVQLMACAEDLHVVNAMVANANPLIIFEKTNFTGKQSPLSDETHILYWNEEYRSAAYGHLCLWRLPELISPVHNGFGTADSIGHTDYPPNATILQRVHQLNGVTSYAHPLGTTYPKAALKEAVNNDYTTRELPIDAALVGIDAMDVLVRLYRPHEIAHWWRLLNCNLRIPASAGTDAMPAGGKSMMGASRVYVKSGEPLNYDQWIEAYRKGHSFVTTGPVVWLEVNGKEPGDVIKGEAGKSLKLSMKAHASSQFGLDSLEIISMGQVIKKIDAKGQKNIILEHEMNVDANTWIVAQAFGSKPPVKHATFSIYQQFACTSPVYCDLKKINSEFAGDAAYWVEWIDLFEQYLDKRNNYGGDKQKAEVKTLLQRARDYYSDLLKKTKR